jgi:hypothetical protein
MKDRLLERKAFLLGMANAVDFGLQFLLPVVLARTLDVESFGKYRLLWLGVYTTLALATLADSYYSASIIIMCAAAGGGRADALNSSALYR